MRANAPWKQPAEPCNVPPVQRREIRLQDGRYLVFYTFDDEPSARQLQSETEAKARASAPKQREASDV